MNPRESQFTGLILVTGVDKPGITQALFETLAPFSITVLDIEQVVIRDRLILTALIRLDPAHATAIDADLALCANRLNIDIATSFQEEALETIAAKTGLLHVVSLSTSIFPEAVSKIATAIASAGGNIERIHRTASYPITAIEFVVSSADQKRLRTELLSVSADTGVDIAVSPGGLMRLAKKLVVMDVDSTLIQQEVIELLAKHAHQGEKVKAITDSAMRGEIDFEESLRARVALLAGLSETVISDVRA